MGIEPGPREVPEVYKPEVTENAKGVRARGKNGLRRKYRVIARRVVKEGVPLQQALAEAGYSPTQQQMGMTRIKVMRPALYDEIMRMRAEVVEISKVLPQPEERKVLIRSRLLRNLEQDMGVKGSNMAAKLLMQDNELNMLVPDNTATINLVQNVPVEWRERYLLPESLQAEKAIEAKSVEVPAADSEIFETADQETMKKLVESGEWELEEDPAVVESSQ